MIRSVFAIACLVLASPQGSQDEELLKALSSSKHSLLEAVQQLSKGAETPISAKFEIEDGVRLGEVEVRSERHEEVRDGLSCDHGDARRQGSANEREPSRRSLRS